MPSGTSTAALWCLAAAVLWAPGARAQADGGLPADAPAVAPVLADDSGDGGTTMAPAAALSRTSAEASSKRRRRPRPPWTNALIPLVEIPAFNITLSTFNYLAFGGEWTHVSPATIVKNAQGGWGFDIDNFAINNAGHPYQGSVYFTSARSSGYGFWGSMLAAFLGSLMWEIAGENEPPSFNDQITTPFAGAILGEALHRTSLALLRAPGTAPAWARAFGALLLNPAGTLNRGLFDSRYDARDFEDDAPMLARFSAGLNSLGSVTTSNTVGRTSVLLGDELHLSARLRSGLPSHRGFAPLRPFDHFDVRFELSVSRSPFATLFINGLLWGRQFQFGQTGSGVWGAFASYDFANPAVLRTSTVAVGFGSTLVVDLPHDMQLQAILIGSGIAWGASGSLAQELFESRDYHIGPGGQLVAEATIVNRTSGSVRAGLRQYVITGAYGQRGLELVTYATFGASVAMGPRFELYGDFVMSSRRAQHYGLQDDANQSATVLRVGITFLTDQGHGATRPWIPTPL